MNRDKIKSEYNRWLAKCMDVQPVDKDVADELEAMGGDEARIEDAFYRDLAFGTGGLRGVIGAGTNRMNVYTVAKASQGLSDYVKKRFPENKDAVDGSFLICEMFAWYKTRGISLLEKLDGLYEEFGYCLNTLHSFDFEGSAGFEKMQRIMEKLREGVDEIGTKKVQQTLDYSKGLDGLPKSDVLKYLLDDNCSVVVRPSGTEPKMKVYISISTMDKETAGILEQKVVKEMEDYFSS